MESGIGLSVGLGVCHRDIDLLVRCHIYEGIRDKEACLWSNRDASTIYYPSPAYYVNDGIIANTMNTPTAADTLASRAERTYIVVENTATFARRQHFCTFPPM